MKNTWNQLFLFVLAFSMSMSGITQVNSQEKANAEKIDLKGTWQFQIDSLDSGEAEQWYNRKLSDKVVLPGSMTTNNKGNDITVNTPWTGSIFDSSWFFKPQYEPYRKPGNIKIPFWLQPVKYYAGAAWYQKTVQIPESFKGKVIELFIERSHWETTVWFNDQKLGMQNSLSTAHIYKLPASLSAGKNVITIRVDNRVKSIDPGQNSHSISDHTQSNWNGMIGKLYIASKPSVFIEDVQLYPDIEKKQVVAHITIQNETGMSGMIPIQLMATSNNAQAVKLLPLTKTVQVKSGTNEVKLMYPMGSDPLLWNEFQPNLYTMSVSLNKGDKRIEKAVSFGMRKFSAQGTQFTINNRLTFLRGTLECAIFPKTGYPPTDIQEWLRIFKIVKSYGLNHVRFHSWCPPEAAFDAADLTGIYLQIEGPSWANQGAVIGDGKPLDKFIIEESERIVKAYGNHPSFCMMVYGNEPAGRNMISYLTNFVKHWKQKDSRRLYSTGAGWPVIGESDFNSTSDPRIQLWGAGLKSIINSQPPRSDYNWSDTISKWKQPTVSHEIGQWCVYPDFKEIAKYTGVLKAKNFEIFSDQLNGNGIGHLANEFLYASGKLQALCYKADIEAALRTKGFGGFQLLDLHDFPGQGTALVGVLNPFWEDKGYITGSEYSQFCNAVVPLAKLAKMVFNNNETLVAPVEIANFGENSFKDVEPSWNIKDAAGKVLYSGLLPKTNISIGNGIPIGEIKQSLAAINEPSKLTLSVSVGSYFNSWEIFVYPAQLPALQNVLVTQQLDDRAIETLSKGGNVLLTLKKGSLKADKGGDIQIGFSTIFWNTAWTNGQAPTTMGVSVNPSHAAFNNFPTDSYSNWQWWDAMSHSNAIVLDSVESGMEPIVRVIDDWVTARSLGLVFECRVGNGKLIVSGIDLLTNQENRPAARQLLYSLKNYMSSNQFNPDKELSIEKIKGLMVGDF